jgi:signal transduction histidine kinase
MSERYTGWLLALTVAGIIGVELTEILMLETEQVTWPGLVLHLAEILVVAGVFVWLWKLRHDALGRLERETQRAAELDAIRADLEKRERYVSGAAERLSALHEDERRMLAYDIHDRLAQLIVSAKQHLDTFSDLWQGLDARARTELETGLDRLGRAVVETRLLLAALHVGTVDTTTGLVPAVRALLHEGQRTWGWDSDLVTNLDGVRLPPAVESAVYRIVREALTSAATLPAPGELGVELYRGDGVLRIGVSDARAGSPVSCAPAPAAGVASLSIEDRARLLGGTCQIEATSDRGSRITVNIPLRQGGA